MVHPPKGPGTVGDITCGGQTCGSVRFVDEPLVNRDEYIYGTVGAISEGVVGIGNAIRNGIVNTFRNALLNTFAPQINTTISSRQGRHVVGSTNFDPSKSELTADPQELAKYAGTGQQVGNIEVGLPGSKERVDFGQVIGIYKDPSGAQMPTTKGIIHYAADGIHIVPARP